MLAAGPRIGEKLLATFLIFSVYWHVGKDYSPDNVANIGGLLFLWVTLPAYGACSYTPVNIQLQSQLQAPLHVPLAHIRVY